MNFDLKKAENAYNIINGKVEIKKVDRKKGLL